MIRTSTILLIILCGIASLQVQGQHREEYLENCGEEKMLAKLLAARPDILAKHLAMENQIYNDTKNGLNNHTEKSGVLYVLPVVVHIIHENGPEDISDAQVTQAIADLNAAYADAGYYYSSNAGNSYDTIPAVDIQVQFCLAKRDPSGNLTTGITRTVSPLTNLDMDTADLDLKNLVRWDPNCYVNIWLVASICSEGVCDIGGYAYLASAAGTDVDGIVCLASYFGSSEANSVVPIHEMGHYLNLYHPFQGGCTNNNCLLDGDYVCDTPPCDATTYYTCGTYHNTCTTDAESGFTTDQPDLYEDYMDYGNLNCMNQFTQGQKDRMLWTMENVRTQLPLCSSCLSPCSSPDAVSFTVPGTSITIGTTVSFTNTSTNTTIYSWSVNGTQFSTAADPSYTFNSLGAEVVTLWADNSDSNCQAAFSDTIYVSCSAVASFTQTSWQVGIGSKDTFTNTSIGATSYQWYVDGTLEATTQNFIDSFMAQGDYSVYLIASNSMCADTTSIFNFVHVGGTCVSSFTYTPAQPITCLPVTFFPDTSCNFSNYYWSFCEQPTLLFPTDTQYSLASVAIGPSGAFLMQDQQGDYHVFVTDYFGTDDSHRLYRLDFGNSMKNIPTLNVINIDTINDARTHFASVVYENGNYYLFLVSNVTVYRANMGSDITSNFLTATLMPNLSTAVGWGHKIEIIKETNNFWALIANRDGYLTVAFLGTNIESDAISYNKWSMGLSDQSYWGMDYVKDSLNNYIFMVDVYNGLERFDFGNSLANTPVITAFGTLADGLNNDLALYQNCDGSFDGILDQQDNTDHITIHLDSATATPTITGTITGLGALQEMSPYIMTDLGVTTFAPDNDDLLAVRLSHGGCNSTNSFSTAKYPPPVSFTTAGPHYVRLVVDQGLPTQSSYCDIVNVDSLNPHPLNLGPDTSICGSGIVVLHAGPWYATYLWSDGYTDSTFTAYLPGTYWVRVTDFCGNVFTDTVVVGSDSSTTTILNTSDTTICPNDSVYICGPGGYSSYTWNNGSTAQCFYTNLGGNYYVTATDSIGCAAVSNRINLNIFPVSPIEISISADTLSCFSGVSVQWYYDSNAIQDATGHIYIARQPGTYSVAIVDSNGCVAISNAVLIASGINDLMNDGNISVYPNPLDKGDWTLEISGPINGVIAEIFDDNGQLVYSTQITQSKSKIDFTAAAGVYVLRVVSNDKYFIRKLVKL